jgi:hypothetical protein
VFLASSAGASLNPTRRQTLSGIFTAYEFLGGVANSLHLSSIGQASKATACDFIATLATRQL